MWKSAQDENEDPMNILFNTVNEAQKSSISIKNNSIQQKIKGKNWRKFKKLKRK